MSVKLVYGVGINDANYIIQPTVDGKRVVCPFYRAWTHILERCYSEKCQGKQPTYVGCSVCKEWLAFSNFKSWMETQNYDGKQLDKDVLFQGNKVYSPENCIFISRDLNNLLTDSYAKRGLYPLGVCRYKRDSKFVSKIMLNGKLKHLGRFSTPQSAHAAWQQAKKQVIYNVAMEQSDERLKTALLLRCNQLQHDIDNGLETKKL